MYYVVLTKLGTYDLYIFRAMQWIYPIIYRRHN